MHPAADAPLLGAFPCRRNPSEYCCFTILNVAHVRLPSPAVTCVRRKLPDLMMNTAADKEAHRGGPRKTAKGLCVSLTHEPPHRSTVRPTGRKASSLFGCLRSVRAARVLLWVQPARLRAWMSKQVRSAVHKLCCGPSFPYSNPIDRLIAQRCLSRASARRDAGS